MSKTATKEPAAKMTAAGKAPAPSRDVWIEFIEEAEFRGGRAGKTHRDFVTEEEAAILCDKQRVAKRLKGLPA